MKLAPGGGISFFLRYFVVPFSLVFFSLSIILAKTSAIKISVCRRKMNPSKMKKKSEKALCHQFRLSNTTPRGNLKIQKLIDLDHLPSAVLSQVGPCWRKHKPDARAPPLINDVCVYIFRDKFWPRDRQNRHSKNFRSSSFTKNPTNPNEYYTHMYISGYFICIYKKPAFIFNLKVIYIFKWSRRAFSFSTDTTIIKYIYISLCARTYNITLTSDRYRTPRGPFRSLSDLLAQCIVVTGQRAVLAPAGHVKYTCAVGTCVILYRYNVYYHYTVFDDDIHLPVSSRPFF